MAKLRINEVAQERGINQSQLQIKSGVTLPLLSRYWRNRTDSVNLDAIEKIAKALGVKPGELIVPDEEAKSEAA
jgi:DNA-binding Xre family transcriptional regulator